MKPSSLVCAAPHVLLVLLAGAACAPHADDDDEAAAAELTRAATCGNGIREAGEQCDDGNTRNLDGCSKQCKFEQTQRMNTVSFMYETNSVCTSNVIGKAIHTQVREPVQRFLNDQLRDGSLSVVTLFTKLSDLLGVNAGPVTVGGLEGIPVAGSDPQETDSWFTAKPSFLDGDRNPRDTMSGTLTGSKLAVDGTYALSIAFPPAVHLVRLSNAKLHAKMGAASVPTSATGASLGHLASENLDPSLKSFETMTEGSLCGNASAKTFADIAVPAAAQQYCRWSNQPDVQYDPAVHTLLDFLVGGCKVAIAQVLKPMQPDAATPGVPAAGAGAPYTFETDFNTKKVIGCKDKNGAAANLNACIASAAFSVGFSFTSQRVIVR
jgi:cysteine-rich repeat protein